MNGITCCWRRPSDFSVARNVHDTKLRGTTALLLAALAACVASPGWAGEQTGINETRPPAATGKLVVNNMAGTIKARGWVRNEVAITGTPVEAVATFEIRGDAKNLRMKRKGDEKGKTG